MQTPALPTDQHRIPEDRVPGILARAAELDRDRRETITVDAIRAAALDAGISPVAVDAALEEYAARGELPGPVDEPAEERAPRFARVRRFFRNAAAALKTPLKLAGVLFVVGLTGAAGEGAIALGWAVWLLLAGRLIWKSRPARKASPFVLGLIFMTVGFALGSAAAEVDEDAIAALFLVGAPLLVLGSVVIKARLPRRFRSTGADSGAGQLRAPTP